MLTSQTKAEIADSVIPDAILQMADKIKIEAGQCITRQYHEAEYLYCLISGEVSFYLQLASVEEQLEVGKSIQAGTVIGWSGFRNPNRYATTVYAKTSCSLYRISQSELMEFFHEEPALAHDFLEKIVITGCDLLQQVRQILAASVKRPINKLHLIQPRYKTRFKLEAEITRKWLQSSAFLSCFSQTSQDLLLDHIEMQRCYSGETILKAGEKQDALYLLANGSMNLYYEPDSKNDKVVFLRSLNSQGQALNVQAVQNNTVDKLTVIASQDSLLCCLPFALMNQLAEENPGFGLELQYALLSLLGNQLRSSRAQLVNQVYDDEVFNIRGILEQAAPQLPITSVLHKVPHMLTSRLTHGDAFRNIEQAQLNGTALEKNIAGLCQDLLQETRAEWRFYQGLQNVYQSVVETPPSMTANEVQQCNAERFQQAFNEVPFIIEGEENLPRSTGHIFILNHLVSHPYHVLPNHFELSLDTNFVSAMILNKKYGDSGMRVVRKGRHDEYAHYQYYSRLGYIQVITDESGPGEGQDSPSQLKRFIDEAGGCLQQGKNLVICPEGRSLWSDESPGLFKPGAFLLAASQQPEPLIVPIAMANFDKRLHHTQLAAVIKPPFRITEQVDVNNKSALSRFLAEYQSIFRGYVEEAQQLAAGSTH